MHAPKSDLSSTGRALVRVSGPLAVGGPAPLAPAARVRRWLMLFLFVIPVACSILYNFVIATPRYASEMSFVVRSVEGARDRFSILNLAQSGAAQDNSEAIVAFVRSRDMLAQIDRDGVVRRAFADRRLDPFARFPSLLNGSTGEDFYRHVGRYVSAEFDRGTDLTRVEVQAFSAVEAQQIAGRILDSSERMVNRLNERARGNLVQTSEAERDRASAALSAILAKLTVVRAQNRLLEPKLDAGAALKLSSTTAQALMRAEVQLAQIARVAPRSPQIQQLRLRRAALEQQLARQQAQAAGGTGSLADRMRGYEELSAERDVAEKQLLAASLALVAARSGASREQLYIERVAEPNLPDEPLYPRAWRNLLFTVLIAGCILWIASSLTEVVMGDD